MSWSTSCRPRRKYDDFLASSDLEDIIAVVDGSSTVVEQIERSDLGLRTYLGEHIAGLLSNEAFVRAIPGHLPGDAQSQARYGLVLDRLRRIAAFEDSPK